jgi:16S rRNA (uracil1498-N3)-methyltransferase
MLNLFFVPEIADRKEFQVTGDEAHHAIKVMRLQIGEELLLADGTGAWVRANIDSTTKDGFRAIVLERGVEQRRLVERAANELEKSVERELIVVQCLMKSNRINEALELLTVAGADRIIPWESERSIAKWQDDMKQKWMSTTIAAAKQARRFTLPVIETPILFAEIGARFGAHANLLILHEEAHERFSIVAQDLRPGPVVLVVGPEGGLSPNEVRALETAGGTAVRLGSYILRSAHAGFAALSAISTLHGSW